MNYLPCGPCIPCNPVISMELAWVRLSVLHGALMDLPQIERLPPVTIEFLRIVNGVEAARLCCRDCNAVHVMSWEELGLPDKMPFPPPGRLWTCSLCGGTQVTAEPEWPFSPTEVSESFKEPATPSLSVSADEEDQDPSSAIRNQLDALLSRLGKT